MYCKSLWMNGGVFLHGSTGKTKSSKQELKISSGLKTTTTTKMDNRNRSEIQIFPCSPPIRSSQRSSNRSTMRLLCSRERPRSTTTPTETCSSAQWMTSRWVPSSDSAASGSRPPHRSHLDAAAAQVAAYYPAADLNIPAIKPVIMIISDW